MQKLPLALWDCTDGQINSDTWEASLKVDISRESHSVVPFLGGGNFHSVWVVLHFCFASRFSWLCGWLLMCFWRRWEHYYKKKLHGFPPVWKTPEKQSCTWVIRDLSVCLQDEKLINEKQEMNKHQLQEFKETICHFICFLFEMLEEKIDTNLQHYDAGGHAAVIWGNGETLKYNPRSGVRVTD